MNHGRPFPASAEAPAILHSIKNEPLDSAALIRLATTLLEDLKGIDVVTLDIEGKSSIADAMIVATGTSVRHVHSLAENVRLGAKDAGHPPLGVEGDATSEWVLVDLGDVIVHVMTADTRDFYSLEKLWSVGPDAGDELAAHEREQEARPVLHSVS